MAASISDKKRKRGADDDSLVVKKAKESEPPLVRLFAVTLRYPKETYFVCLKIYGDLPDHDVMESVFRDIIVQQLEEGERIPTVKSFTDLGVEVHEISGAVYDAHAVVERGLLVKQIGTPCVPCFDTHKAVISVDGVLRHHATCNLAVVQDVVGKHCNQVGLISFVSTAGYEEDDLVSYRVTFDND
jgi:hypothetical protein